MQQQQQHHELPTIVIRYTSISLLRICSKCWKAITVTTLLFPELFVDEDVMRTSINGLHSLPELPTTIKKRNIEIMLDMFLSFINGY